LCCPLQDTVVLYLCYWCLPLQILFHHVLFDLLWVFVGKFYEGSYETDFIVAGTSDRAV
jgi:hypothetical protein